MNKFYIREFSFDEDDERVLNLWKEIEIGMNVGNSDSPEEIKKKIQRDADNTGAINFYNNHGWHRQPEDLVFAKEF